MQEIQTAIAAVVQELFSVETDVELTRPDEQFGDYSTNVALRLSKQVGKTPREIADAITQKLPGMGLLHKSEVAGPGFINLFLRDETLVAMLDAEPVKSLAGKKWLVEYSDPNPFKPLHAGHLYTTLVGDTIARLVEYAGAETIRLNYGGDVGRHVGISMWAIVRFLGGEHPEKLADIPEAERPAWLGKRYVEGTAVFEEDETTRPEIVAANKRVYQIHAENDHESPFAQIYWTCRQWSYDYFATLYEQLQVVPFTRMIPESEITEEGVRTVREHTVGDPLNKTNENVYVYSGDSGAIIFHGEQMDESLHTRVFINSEGIPTYETKEVGLILEKWRSYQFDTSIVITANEQEQYMRVVLASIAQFAPKPAERTRHLNHGVVKLQGGVKMSSRKGNVVTALEILSAAREAGEVTGTNPSEETILAAVKYAFARNRIGGDIAYDPKESIALEGNSGPYLQYAHARARSILAKSEGVQQDVALAGLTSDERGLLRKMTEYAEVVERATQELMPHHICTYLYELAQRFNQFYEHNRVIDDEREAVRLRLVGHYADTLRTGLNLLGITTPDRM